MIFSSDTDSSTARGEKDKKRIRDNEDHGHCQSDSITAAAACSCFLFCVRLSMCAGECSFTFSSTYADELLEFFLYSLCMYFILYI